MCSSCADHPACNPYESQEAFIGQLRGWGEPLSASQATTWAEYGSEVWGTIFDQALEVSTNFSCAPNILPTPSIVPEFNVFLEGKVNGATLRGSGTALWHIRISLAGLVEPNATTESDCILGLTTVTSVSLGNSYPICSRPVQSDLNHTADHTNDRFSQHLPFPSSKPFIPTVACHESNYLAVLTLGWTYVLSAYWSEVQNGTICYTGSKARHCSFAEVATMISDNIVLFVHDSEMSGEEVQWWRSILAPEKGWEARIDRHDQSWCSPWCLENENASSRFVVVCQGTTEPKGNAPAFKTALAMLRRFAKSRGILSQVNMALMAALAIPTHNVWSVPVRLPLPRHSLPVRGIQDPSIDITDFERLVDLLPRLVTISLIGVDGLLRSAFYDDDIHSLASGQWIQPAVVSWPHLSTLAAEVGCRRCPQLAKWWIGMAISGLLSKQTISMLVGTGMWPTNLALSLWTTAKDSYFCTVFERDIGLPLQGKGHLRTTPRADELLMLFLTSGHGPQGRLVDIASCPWKPPGDVLFDKTSSKVLLLGNSEATARLVYNTWVWGNQPSTKQPPAKFVFGPDSLDQMAEKSGAATRAVIGWLENERGPDADINVELHALRHQIRLVEDDSHIGGSDQLSHSFSDISSPIPPHIPQNTEASLGAFGGKRFYDAEVMDAWSTKPIVTEIQMTAPVDSYGFCGLNAVNFGLSELDLSPIGVSEALKILSRTEDDIRRDGMTVIELERLVNTRDRSIAVVDGHSGERRRLITARYQDAVINIGVDLRPHFRAMSQMSS